MVAGGLNPLEAVLRISILSLFVEYLPGNASTTGAYDQNVFESRGTWCDITNACAECHGNYGTRCLEPSEYLGDADLCGCCYSCISTRDLGESCGSQLSVMHTSSGVTSNIILATTWCRKGLVCINFECHNTEPEIAPSISSRFKIDTGSKTTDSSGHGVIELETYTVFSAEGLDETTVSSSWAPAIVEDDLGLPKTVTRLSAPFSTDSFQQNEKEEKTEPCYAKKEETMTMTSHKFDDLLGQVEEISVKDKRFQLVYTGDMLSELEVLLTVIDRTHENSLLRENETDLLIDGFLDLLFLPDEKKLPDYQKSRSDSPADQYTTFAGVGREKRGLESSQDDVLSFEAPKNIEEILIRGASAHREYFDEARGRFPDSNTVNKSSITDPVETQIQGDESTVRVHITNRPRKVQTLIDLEEKGENDEIEDEELLKKGQVKHVESLSPLVNAELGSSWRIPWPFGGSGTTERYEISQKPTKYGSTNISRVLITQWNETLMSFDDRLTQVEIKIDVVETVLAEIAKWCNLGILSMPRDCVIPQNSDINYHRRWRPDVDERLALASEIDAIQFPGNRRKPNPIIPQRNFHDYPHHHHYHHPRKMPTGERRIDYRGRDYEPLDKNLFRINFEDGKIRRGPIGGLMGNGRPAAKLPCRSYARQGSSRNKSSPHSSRSLALDRSKRLVRGTLRELFNTQDLKTLQETQIPVPLPSEEMVMELRNLQNRAKIFPQMWTSTGQVMVWDENEALRDKRSVKTTDRVSRPFDVREKGHSGLFSTIEQPADLFQLEISTGKESAFDKNPNLWPKAKNVKQDEEHGDRVTFDSFPLIIAGSSGEVFSSPGAQRMMSQQLFRNSDILETTESTAGTMTTNSEDTQEVRDLVSRNSTIRMEEIRAVDYEDVFPEIRSSSGGEDDFDHIYESVETEGEDGDFEYVTPDDRVEYVDGSSVEIVTETPDPGVKKPVETELKSITESSDILSRHKRIRRDLTNGDNDRESRKQVKREVPLLLFGSGPKHDPKTIVWPSKWIGYRRDRIQRGKVSQAETTMSSKFWQTKSTPITTTPTSSLPIFKTSESFIIGRGLKSGGEISGEINYVIPPRIPTVERRVKKNRRKSFQYN